MNVKMVNIDESYRNGEKSEIEHTVTNTVKNECCLETAAFLRICFANHGEKRISVHSSLEIAFLHLLSLIVYNNIVMSVRSVIMKKY